MQVVALLATAGFAIGAKQLFQLVEQVGLWPEVGEVFSLGHRRSHRLLHRSTLIAVIAIALYHRWRDAFSVEDVLKSPLYRAGAGAGGPSNGYDGVTLRHRPRESERRR